MGKDEEPCGENLKQCRTCVNQQSLEQMGAWHKHKKSKLTKQAKFRPVDPRAHPVAFEGRDRSEHLCQRCYDKHKRSAGCAKQVQVPPQDQGGSSSSTRSSLEGQSKAVANLLLEEPSSPHDLTGASDAETPTRAQGWEQDMHIPGGGASLSEHDHAMPDANHILMQTLDALPHAASEVVEEETPTRARNEDLGNSSLDGGASLREEGAQGAGFASRFVLGEEAGAGLSGESCSLLGSAVKKLLVELGLEEISTAQVLRRLRLGAQVVVCDDMLRSGFGKKDVGDTSKRGPFFFTRPVELFILAV